MSPVIPCILRIKVFQDRSDFRQDARRLAVTSPPPSSIRLPCTWKLLPSRFETAIDQRVDQRQEAFPVVKSRLGMRLAFALRRNLRTRLGRASGSYSAPDDVASAS